MIQVSASVEEKLASAAKDLADGEGISLSKLLARALRAELDRTRTPDVAPQMLAPYVSVLLLDADPSFHPTRAMRDLLSAGLRAQVESLGTTGKRQVRIGEVARKRIAGWQVLGWWYTMEGSPGWLAKSGDGSSSPALRDVKNHLGLLLLDKEFAALACTQTSLRNKAVHYLTSDLQTPAGDPLCFSRVPNDDLTLAFMAGDARKTSMEGVHRPVPAKPDAKILMGPDLRLAIDPFGDQSFRLSSVVSDLESARLIADYRGRLPAGSPLKDLPPDDAIGSADRRKRRRFVGLSLRDGVIWTRSTRKMSQFLTELNNLRHLLTLSRKGEVGESRGMEQPGFDVLVRRAKDVRSAALGEALDFELRLPFPDELADEDARQEEVLAIDDWMRRGAFSIREVDAERLFVGASLDGEPFASLRIQPVVELDGSVHYSLEVESDEEARVDERLELLDRILRDFRRKACIWYLSGYAIQQGRVFRPQYRDVPFRSWSWLPFFDGDTAYDPSAEKPIEKAAGKKNPKKIVTRQVDLSKHGWDGDTLFDFVVRNVESLFDSKGRDWHLVCDDRSLEIADFVYVEPERRRLCLIHVKGAASTGGGRSIAPGKYEIVVSQATKNLRFLEPRHLLANLEAQRGLPIESASWAGVSGTPGKMPNRDAAIAAIRGLGAYPDKHVVVLQPHTTRQAWTAAERRLRAGELDEAGRVQFLRLKTLLADLEAACKKVSASLAVWGDGSAANNADLLFPRGDLK